MDTPNCNLDVEKIIFFFVPVETRKSRRFPIWFILIFFFFFLVSLSKVETVHFRPGRQQPHVISFFITGIPLVMSLSLLLLFGFLSASLLEARAAPPRSTLQEFRSLGSETLSFISLATNPPKKTVRATLTLFISPPSDKRLMSWHAQKIDRSFNDHTSSFYRCSPLTVSCLYLTLTYTIFPCMLWIELTLDSVVMKIYLQGLAYEQWFILLFLSKCSLYFENSSLVAHFKTPKTFTIWLPKAFHSWGMFACLEIKARQRTPNRYGCGGQQHTNILINYILCNSKWNLIHKND